MNPLRPLSDDAVFETVRWCCVAALASVAWTSAPARGDAACLPGETVTAGRGHEIAFGHARFRIAGTRCVDGVRQIDVERPAAAGEAHGAGR